MSDYRLHTGPQGYRPLREFLVGKLKRDAGDRLHGRRYPAAVGLAAGTRSRQRRAARARRHRHLRGGQLPRHDQPAARGSASTSSASRSTATACGWMRWKRRSPISRQGRAAEIHLHHPDRAEPDRDHPRRRPPHEMLRACRAVRRADLRGRLLRRSDLGRQTAAGDLRDEQDGNVIHIGSFSKTIAPALRVGFIVAPWSMHVAHAGAQDRRRLGRRSSR